MLPLGWLHPQEGGPAELFIEKLTGSLVEDDVDADGGERSGLCTVAYDVQSLDGAGCVAAAELGLGEQESRFSAARCILMAVEGNVRTRRCRLLHIIIPCIERSLLVEDRENGGSPVRVGTVGLFPAAFLLVEGVVRVGTDELRPDRDILLVAHVIRGVVVIGAFPVVVTGPAGRAVLRPAGTSVDGGIGLASVLGRYRGPGACGGTGLDILGLPLTALQRRGEAVVVELPSFVQGVVGVAGGGLHDPYGLGILRTDDVCGNEKVGEDCAVKVFVRDAEVLALRTWQTDAESLGHQRTVVEDLLRVFGGIVEICLAVVLLDAESQIGLGEEESGGPLRGAAALVLRQGGREIVVCGLKVADGGIIGLDAAGTGVTEVRDLGVLEHKRHTAVKFSQSEVAHAAQEQRLSVCTRLEALGVPFDVVQLADGEVGVRNDLVENVPKILGKALVGGPGALDVAEMLTGSELVLSVENVGTCSFTEADTHTRTVREVEFAHVVIPGVDGIHDLVTGLECVEDSDAVLDLLGQKLLV